MLKKILSLSSMAFLVYSCGISGPELTPLEKGKDLTEPKYRKASFDSLLEGLSDEQRTFSGSLIIWDDSDSAHVTGVSEVIKASNQAKRAEVVYKKSLKPVEVSEEKLESLQEGISSAEQNLETKRAEHLSEYLDKLGSKVDQLKGQHQSLMFESLKLEHKKDFETFCDAKYVEFLSSHHVLDTSYTKRPTPFSLCEKYYQDKGYYASESCQDSSEGQNYLKCFWNPSFIKNSKLELHDRVNGEFKKLPKDTFDWESFSAKWDEVDWISNLKENGDYLHAGLLMFSDSEEYYLYFDREAKKVSQNLNPVLADFFNSNMPLDEFKKNRNNYDRDSYTHSDLLFNYPFVAGDRKQSLLKLGKGYSELARLSQEKKEFYGSSYIELDTSTTEEGKSLSILKSQEVKQQKELSALQETANENQAAMLKLKAEIATKLAKENLAHSLWPNMELVLRRDSKEEPMMLSWTLDQELFTETFVSQVSEKPLKVSDEAEMLSSFNKEEASLEFTLKGTALENMGWDKYEKFEAPRFNSLSLIEKGATSVKVSLDYVHYENTVPMFTGKLFVYDKDGKELYLGSILMTSD